MNLRSDFDIPTSAIVLAEGAFGETSGKTANGVTLHSEIFDVEVVIDSDTSGRPASDVLESDSADDVPIVDSMEEAIEQAPDAKALVIGVAPAGGQLPPEWRSDIEMAIRYGCSVVSGLHVFLSEDPHWQSLAEEAGVELYDVRKPPTDDNLRVGDGRVDDLKTPVILTMGTDCAVGKRTTTFELYREAQSHGIDAAWVATGQTGIIVGAHSGTVIDRVPADFTAGIVEDLVCAAAEDHDMVFVEGQASLSHRAYSGVTLSILHGSWPDVVVLADDPERKTRTHFDRFDVWDVKAERDLIESLSDADVAGVSTWGNHDEQDATLNVPVGNVFQQGGAERLLDAVLTELEGESPTEVSE